MIRIRDLFGEHGIRAALGHVVYQHGGEVAAANLLGDRPKQILKAYAMLDAKQVDVPSLDAFRGLGQRLPDNSTAVVRETKPDQDAAFAEMRRLHEEWKNGDWSDDDYKRMKAAYWSQQNGRNRAHDASRTGP